MASALISFVMLGIIPGTTIQLTFRDWAFAVMCGVLLFAIGSIARRLIIQLLHARQHQHGTTVAA